MFGFNPRCVAGFTRAADATQYAQKDAVMPAGANGAPLVFDPNHGETWSGKIMSARMVICPASGTLVTTNLQLSLYLFRSNTNIPFSTYPADNVAMAFSAAALKELVGVFKFLPTGWDPVDAAGGYQAVGLDSRPYAPYNLDDIVAGGQARPAIRGVIRVEGSVGWNPGNVAQDIQVALDVEANS